MTEKDWETFKLKPPVMLEKGKLYYVGKDGKKAFIREIPKVLKCKFCDAEAIDPMALTLHYYKCHHGLKQRFKRWLKNLWRTILHG